MWSPRTFRSCAITGEISANAAVFSGLNRPTRFVVPEPVEKGGEAGEGVADNGYVA